jgi:hypothetical protein
VERIRFVTHRGQRILLLDFTNCTAEDVATISEHAPAIVTSEPLGSVLAVADFTGAEFNREAVEEIKISTALDRPHIKRAAWVLTDNLPKALYESICNFSARDFPVFHTLQEAMDYLVS